MTFICRRNGGNDRQGNGAERSFQKKKFSTLHLRPDKRNSWCKQISRQTGEENGNEV